MTITSVITRWFHLPQWHNISHNKGHHHSDITSVTKNNIFGLNVVLTSDTHKKINIGNNICKYPQFGNIKLLTTSKSNYIMKNNFLQTPSKLGVLLGKTFSHTPDEARSVGLAKACVFQNNLFCYREIRSKNCGICFGTLHLTEPTLQVLDQHLII